MAWFGAVADYVRHPSFIAMTTSMERSVVPVETLDAINMNMECKTGN